jgi:hypothetical protein
MNEPENSTPQPQNQQTIKETDLFPPKKKPQAEKTIQEAKIIELEERIAALEKARNDIPQSSIRPMPPADGEK